MQDISAQDIIDYRLARNGLSQPFASPGDCMHALVGIQSQFQQWAEVSLFNRCMPALTMQQLAALYGQHHILNLWGQRHTLHMYVQEDWDRVSDVFEPLLTSKPYAHSRYPQEFAAMIACIEEKCAQQGSEVLSKAWLKTLFAQYLPQLKPEEYGDPLLIHLCCLRGIFFGLPEKPGIKTFVGRSRIRKAGWQPDPARAARALEDMMLRYFRSYGPATLADFCHWSGLTKSTAAKAHHAVQEQLTSYAHGGRTYFVLGEEPQDIPQGNLFLLGKFDPLFVSYKHKDWIIPPALEKQVWRSAGWVEGVIIGEGKALGTWRHGLKGRKMTLEVSSFGPIKSPLRKKIQKQGEKLATFWEKELHEVLIT